MDGDITSLGRGGPSGSAFPEQVQADVGHGGGGLSQREQVDKMLWGGPSPMTGMSARPVAAGAGSPSPVEGRAAQPRGLLQAGVWVSLSGELGWTAAATGYLASSILPHPLTWGSLFCAGLKSSWGTS